MDYEAVKKKIDDEFKKEFYKVDYLSKFKIKEKNSGISAIIPTYNRCPYNKSSKKYIYNPLYICVKALLLQKLPLKDIIIIDDCSNDNTKQVVEDLKKEAYNKKGIDLVYIKNEERRGSSISRNSGAKQAKGKYLFFLDDDCVPAPYLSFIALTVIRYLQKKDKKFAVLVLPVYNRSSYPEQVISIENLTKNFIKRGIKSASFNSFPLEYLSLKDKYFNKDLRILKPIEVFQTWGHFLIERSKYLDVGGFPDFATWPNKAGEEQEFACRLIENVYSLYYLPGIKASSFHGAYGARVGKFKGDDWLARITNNQLSLKKFSKICEHGVVSGNRVGLEDFCYSKIISRFCILYKRNLKEAINWAQICHQEFVVEAKDKWFVSYSRRIESREERERIWNNAIDDGLNLLLNEENRKIRKLREFINSLRIKKKLEFEEESKLKRFWDMILKE